MSSNANEKEGGKESAVLGQEAEKKSDEWKTIGEWLNDEGSKELSDFLKKNGFTLNETFADLANGTDDSYFTTIAARSGIGGKIVQNFQTMVNAARSQGGVTKLTKEDIEFLRYMREMHPFFITAFQVFARNPSDATSTVASQDSTQEEDSKSIVAKDELTPKQARDAAKAWAGVAIDIPLTQSQVRQNAQKAKLKVSDKEIEQALSHKHTHLMVTKGKDKVKLGLTRTVYKLYDQFDGMLYDPIKEELNENDDNYITAAHIIPDKAAKNGAIMIALNKGFKNKFDFNDRRNIILIKNKYSVALEAHKIGITWSEKRGYYIQVGQDCMQQFGHVHDKPLLFFERCNRTKHPQFPPYRRAIVYSYLALMQQ